MSLKQLNQSGIAHLGIFLVIIVALVAAAGWYVWDRNKDKDNNQSTNSSQTNTTSPAEPTNEVYDFKELGVTMEILPGWKVSKDTVKENGNTFYYWEVEKAGADGKLRLAASGFQGGFTGCSQGESKGALSEITVNEVAATENEKFVFLSAQYKSDREAIRWHRIALADQKYFATVNDSDAPKLKNSDLKTGRYYGCLGEPTPGWDLNLYSGKRKDVGSVDSIQATSGKSSTTNPQDLPADADSYEDLKAMLVTLK